MSTFKHIFKDCQDYQCFSMDLANICPLSPSPFTWSSKLYSRIFPPYKSLTCHFFKTMQKFSTPTLSTFSFPYVAFPSFSPLPCLRERSVCFPLSPPPPLILMLSPLSLRPAPSSVSPLLLQVFLFVNNFPISFQTSSQLRYSHNQILFILFLKTLPSPSSYHHFMLVDSSPFLSCLAIWLKSPKKPT